MGTETVMVWSTLPRILIQYFDYITLNGYYTIDTEKQLLGFPTFWRKHGGTTLFLITPGVLRLEPWYQASYMIPLAGMIFAASMTNISLALERLHAELVNGVDFERARSTAFRTSMIPIINSCFAVGLISLPGMMTGQILSGVSPLIAARYQIMVMCMIFGAAGLSTVCFLVMVRSNKSFIEHSQAKSA